MMLGLLPLALLALAVYGIARAVSAAGGRRRPSRDARGPERMEVKVFRLAARRGGRLTLSDLVLETGLGMKQAEALMDRLADGLHVRLEVSPEGAIVYEFPEILGRAVGGGGPGRAG